MFCLLFGDVNPQELGAVASEPCVARQNMMVKHMVEIVVDRRQADRQTDRGGLKICYAPQRHTSALPLNNATGVSAH